MRQPIIYARVSTSDKQDYNRQIDDLTKLAINHSYKESHIRVLAESISGYKKGDSRPKLTELLNMVEEAPNNYIIYTSEISRIGRNPIETRRIIDHLTDIGVPVFIASIGQATLDKDGKRNMIMNIILQVLIEYANLEAETFKERSKSGLLRSAKLGKAGGGLFTAYGYMKDANGFLVINPDESHLVEEIFVLYRNGQGIKVIAGILNERKVPTRLNKTHAGKVIKHKTFEKDGSLVKWSDKQIHDILRNTLYKGERRFKGEIIKTPAIVSKELFDECSFIMAGKTHRNYLTSYTYLLKDLCTCGKCGRNYFARYKPDTERKKGESYYMCSSRLGKAGNCGNVGVNIALIESVVYDLLTKSDTILKYLNNNNDLKGQLQSDIKRLQQDIPSTSKALERKNKEKERLLDLYLEGGAINKATYNKRNTDIDAEIINLNSKLETLSTSLREKTRALESLNNVKTTKQMLIKAMDNREQLRAIFKQFVHKIVIDSKDRDEAIITVKFFLSDKIFDVSQIKLDLSGVRKRQPVLRYMQGGMSRIKPEYGKFFFDSNDWITIDQARWIVIPE